MARSRCKKCGKFMSARLIAGCDPATSFIMVSDFSIHLCFNRRDSHGKFSRTAPRTLLQSTFKTYSYAAQQQM